MIPKKSPKVTELAPEFWPEWAKGLEGFAEKSGKSIRHLFGQSIHDLYVFRMGREPPQSKHHQIALKASQPHKAP